MSLANILTIVLSIIIECCILIYYSNSVMTYRYSRFKSNAGIIIGHILYCALCFLGIPPLNIISFIVINFAVLYIGFSENIGSLILKTTILTILMMFGELLASFFYKVDLAHSFYQYVNIIEETVFTLASKLIYYISVIMLKHISVRKIEKDSPDNMLYFLALPFSTLILLGCVGRICSKLDADNAIRLSIAMLVLIVSNYIVYIAYDKVIDKMSKINQLQEIDNKEKLDYVSYQLMKEKFAELRVMVHDFEKYYNAIEARLNDNQAEVHTLLHDLKNKNKEYLLVEYTNNKALNILLSQKLELCNRENIDFQTYIQDLDLSFINEMDIISIFANLIDNAVESCRQSKQKKIYLSIYAVNNAYIVIRIDNNSDMAPAVRNGILHTRKQDSDRHGIGMISVKQGLKHYNGSLKWAYNKDTKIFTTTAMINYFALSQKNVTNSVDF